MQYKHKCAPSVPCAKDTPVGKFFGYKCKLGPEIYHRTHFRDLESILNDGELKPAQHQDDDVFGNQPAISMSSCYQQRVGGDVKLVFDTETVKEHHRAPDGACYIPYPEKETGLTPLDKLEQYEIEKCINEKGMHPADATIKCGSLATRGKYSLQPDIYAQECEYNLKEPLSIDRSLKKMELWLGNFDRINCFSHIDLGETASYRPVHMDWGDMFRMRIQKIKELGERIGIPVEVKTCSPWFYFGYNKYAPTTQRNIELLGSVEPRPGNRYEDFMEDVRSGYPPDDPDFDCDCNG